MELIHVKLPAARLGIELRMRNDFKKIEYAGRKLCSSAQMILAAVFSFSNRKDVYHATFNASYNQMQEEFGLCRSSVAKGVESLKSMEMIEANRSSERTEYTFIGKEKHSGYDKIPLYLYTAEILVNGQYVRLTKAQVRILAYLMQEGEKGNARRCECSIAELSKRLKIGKTTIKKALRLFLRAKLISRPAKDRGNSCAKKSVYHIDERLYTYKKYKKARKAKSEAEQQALEAQERIAYYKQEQEKNVSSARRYEERMLSIPAIKDVKVSLGKLDIAIAKASVYEPQNVPNLEARQIQLKKRYKELMRFYKIDSRYLLPSAYVRCKECNDTGQRSDKTLCTCWKVIRW